MGTVKNHFERFLLRFPTLESLAKASEDELLVGWKGLGYYRRAKNLKKIAEAIFSKHAGAFPTTAEALQTIPGIGPYTSQAIISIGMDQRGLAVDANLERVISRLLGLTEAKGLKLQKKIYSLFTEEKVFPKGSGSFRAINEALMDLGRTFCQARKTSCELCPLNKSCTAFKLGTPLNFPIDDAGPKTKAVDHELSLLRVFVLKGKKILVYKKSSKQWLSGQYEVPTLTIKSTDEKFIQYPILKKKLAVDKCEIYQTGITKYKILNYILEADEKKLKALNFPESVEWRDFRDESSNLSTATLKGLQRISQLA